MITEVPDAAAVRALGPKYVVAVGKVVTSHVRNELAGAAAFHEPAIALAPSPKPRSTGLLPPREWSAVLIEPVIYRPFLGWRSPATRAP